MTDIVERLRLRGTGICCEAADEIERLRRKLNLLRELHHSAEKEVNELRATLRECLKAIVDLEKRPISALDNARRALDPSTKAQGGPTDPPTGAPDQTK